MHLRSMGQYNGLWGQYYNLSVTAAYHRISLGDFAHRSGRFLPLG